MSNIEKKQNNKQRTNDPSLKQKHVDIVGINDNYPNFDKETFCAVM